MDKSEEIKRITGPFAEAPIGGFVVRFPFDTLENASDVIDRVRELMLVLITAELPFDGDLELWSSVLPKWFIDALSTETELSAIQTKAKLDLNTLDRRSFTKKALDLLLFRNADLSKVMSLNHGASEYPHPSSLWTLDAFLVSFLDENRSWFWADCGVLDDHKAFVDVLIDGLPFASGALECIIYAAGAQSIEEYVQD